MNRKTKFCSLVATMALAAGCSGSPATSLSPTGATSVPGLTANPDGSTLKVTAPSPQSPSSGETVGSVRPSFSFGGAASANNVPTPTLNYRVEVRNEDGSVAAEALGQGSPVEIGNDLEAGKSYIWRVRAELDGAFGPWSAGTPFQTAAVARAAGGGGFGPQRNISLGEAFNIITRVHNDLRWDLGGRSSRESRIQFLFAAVAAIHYGHPRFNPAGGDPLWCVKDAGGGRPPSDDVLVRCDTTEAWDLIGGAGADGYSFHLDYLGTIRGQNIYPPPASALGSLGR